MKQLFCIGLFCTFAALCSSGCNRSARDVTQDRSYGDFAPVVGTWQLKIPLRLVSSEGNLYVVCSDTVFHSSKEIAVLPPGVRIRIEKLMYRETFDTSYLDAVGSVISGQHAGQTVIFGVSLFPGGMVEKANSFHGRADVVKMVWEVDQKKLEKVQ